MDYEYDDSHDDYGGRILWGRFAFWGIALLLMFLLGRFTAGDGVPKSELDTANEQIIELAAENEELRQEVETLRASASQGGEGQEEQPTDTPTETPARTYEVQSGDTLNSIAQRECGGIRFAAPIAELNSLDESNRLRVGQVLTLPDDCNA